VLCYGTVIYKVRSGVRYTQQCLLTGQRHRLGQYNRERQRHTEFRIRMAHTIRLCSRHEWWRQCHHN